MGRDKRRTSAVLSSGSPKSPRVRQGSSVATDDGAASTQAHHPSPPQPPRTPQREDRSISPVAGQDLRRASRYPNPHRGPVRNQPAAVPVPVAPDTTSGPLRPPPPSSPAAGQDLRRASPYPNPNRDPVRHQPAAVVATASTSGPLRPEFGVPPSSSAAATTGTPSPPSQSSTKPSTAVLPVVTSSKSYASALKGGGPGPNQNPYADSSRRLYIYLEKSAIISEATACHNHRGPIITLKETGSSDLTTVHVQLHLEQYHLEEYDPELAYDIFSSQDRFEEWLYAAVSEFLTSKKIVENAVAVAGMNAAHIITPSHKTLEDFVKEQGSLVSTESIFGGIFKLCVASDIGMRLVHGFLVYILNVHKQGRTWNGEFSTSDMVVVGNCLTCRITPKSRPGNSHCRAVDLQKIAEIFKEMFTSNEGMALYFDVLQKDLCGASNVEVEAEWFREYLLSHVALKSSIGRFYLLCGLDQARDTIKSNGGLIPSVLLEGSDWMSIIPCKITKDTPCTDSSLFHVFYFNYDPTKGGYPFAPTNGGLLRYIRNLLQHEHHYINVEDHTEIEQFAAKIFPLALPYVLRGLLSHHKMNGPFKVHWEEFRSSRVGNDGNTEVGISIHISFLKMAVVVDKSEDCFVWKD